MAYKSSHPQIPVLPLAGHILWAIVSILLPQFPHLEMVNHGKHVEGGPGSQEAAGCKSLLSLLSHHGPLGSCSGFWQSPPPHSLSCRCRVMLDSVTHSTFLPNASFCDPLMSWTDLFSNEEYYPAFEHQTGRYTWGGPSELSWAGAGGGAGLGW